MKKLTLPFICLLVTILVLLFSLSRIISWFFDNNRTNNTIKLIEEITIIRKNDAQEKEEETLAVDFTELRKINNETVGWINVPNTNINYPIVKHDDNSYYLTHSFDKTKNSAGWVFLDYRNSLKDLKDNTIVYAHGRVDGTMFGSLKNLLDKTYLENEEHYLYLSTPTNNYIFQIFSLYHIKTTDDYIKTSFQENEKSPWLDLITKRSVHNFNIKVEETDKIFTLSTCYNNKEKLVLHSKLIKKENRY